MTEPLPDWVSGTMEERFSEIYRRRFWEAPESISGPGSSLTQTRALIERLPTLWRELDVKTILDAPCGDFNWMQAVDLSDVHYTGADIVADIVTQNQARFGSDRIRFTNLNLTRDPLPKCDLVFCRDGLVHLSYQDIDQALLNLARSGCRFLMATTFPGHFENRDIHTGDWRTLNLEIPPFNFPPPLHLLIEGCPEEGFEDKAMGLWRIRDLPRLAAS
jgi:hypothetical protein